MMTLDLRRNICMILDSKFDFKNPFSYISSYMLITSGYFFMFYAKIKSAIIYKIKTNN